MILYENVAEKVCYSGLFRGGAKKTRVFPKRSKGTLQRVVFVTIGSR